MAMKKHERLLEEYEDAYFALLMEEVAKKEGERLEALNKALQSDPEAAVPESLDKRCMETIRRHFAHQQRRSALRRTGKVLRLAAVLMAVTVLLFTTAFAVSEEFRVATLNLMLTITEEYTQFSINASEGTGGIKKSASNTDEKSEYFQNAEIGWIPEGFVCSENIYNTYVRFENDLGEFFYVAIQSGEGGVLRVDTENPDSIENISINGNEGLCIVKNGEIGVITADLENCLYIEVGASLALTVDTAKKISENILIL